MNGITVRLAMFCCNALIVPIVWLIEKMSAQQFNSQHWAYIYQSMGIMGAEAAYLSRTR